MNNSSKLDLCFFYPRQHGKILSIAEGHQALEALCRHATVRKTLRQHPFASQGCEIHVQWVSPTQSKRLNTEFRHKPKPTNVLSFPGAPYSMGMTQPLLGEIVFCDTVIQREAREQCKDIRHHYIHLFVHSCLHLLGWDHQTDQDAQRMEALETELLQTLNLPNPYEEPHE